LAAVTDAAVVDAVVFAVVFAVVVAVVVPVVVAVAAAAAPRGEKPVSESSVAAAAVTATSLLTRRCAVSRMSSAAWVAVPVKSSVARATANRPLVAIILLSKDILAP
jgi:hypothetical protein